MMSLSQDTAILTSEQKHTSEDKSKFLILRDKGKGGKAKSQKSKSQRKGEVMAPQRPDKT